MTFQRPPVWRILVWCAREAWEAFPASYPSLAAAKRAAKMFSSPVRIRTAGEIDRAMKNA